ncbi:hypothetical protein [Shewanella fidelis]|uniref:hypothetical protein n=1 Tax=Shewanella fidelis TaxID=173509 RepID=UPI00048E9BD6|nr:hypothetical protein [Shewanella fidelis]
MNKMLIAAAVVAAGAGGYWYSQQSAPLSTSDDVVLSYVPADTPVFSAQLQPFPIKSYINSLSEAYRQYPPEALSELENEPDERAQFFVSLFKSYTAAMKDGDTFTKTFGLADNIRSYLYSLGAMPVLKVEVEDADAIWALLDKAEAESGLAHTLGNLKGAEYRSYLLTDPEEQQQISLVFAVRDGIFTTTLSTSFLDASVLENALGVTPVDNSIVDAKIIENIINKHGFTNEGVSYINHQEIVTGLTSTDGNQLAGQLSKLYGIMGEDPIDYLKTPACRAEFAAIASNWPRTVAGYDELRVTDNITELGFRTVIEGNNKVLLDAYQKLRGFLPAYTQDIDNTVFNIGLGVDINQMVPALTTIWDDMLTPEYQCEPLAAMQMQMSQQSPAMLGMFTGMANGVKGLGVSLVDYKISDDVNSPQLESLDAVVSLSADNPAILFNMAKSFMPELANVQLPENGDAIELSSILPIPAEMNIAPKLALKGQHLVLFSGDKGAAIANDLQNESLQNNGLFMMSTDYMKLIDPLITFVEMTGEPIPEELEAMKHYDMRTKFSIDFKPEGVEIDVHANSRSSK